MSENMINIFPLIQFAMEWISEIYEGMQNIDGKTNKEFKRETILCCGGKIESISSLTRYKVINFKNVWVWSDSKW